MEQIDDLLEHNLQRLDHGESLEQILAGLPPDQVELAPLLKIAVRTRNADHPQMNPLLARSQRTRLVGATHNGNKGKVKARLTLPVILTGVSTIALALVLGLVLLFAVPANAHAATLANIQGVVEVAPSADNLNWSVAQDGQQVTQGEVVRTRMASSVTLVYFDGSKTQVGSESSLEIAQLSGGPGSALRLELRQLYGASSHDVVKLHGSEPFYRVLTPAGTAVVHGTSFSVDVDSAGGVYYAVNHGRVAVSQGQATVYLTAGQATLVKPQGNPESPSYEFAVQGQIESISGENWVVASLPVQVSADLANGFAVNDFVAIRGTIVAGVYVADMVTYAQDESTSMSFTGTINSISATQWVVGGTTVLVDSGTTIDPDLQVNDPVRVTFSIQADGSYLASAIQRLEVTPEPTPTDAATETETSAATESETPAGTLTETPGPGETATETMAVTPTEEMSETPSEVPTEMLTETPGVTLTPEPTREGKRAGCDFNGWMHPDGSRLADRWKVPYQEIMGWYCRGYGFGEVDLAYELAHRSGRPVQDIFALCASGKGWGEISKEVDAQQVFNPTDPSHSSQNDPSQSGQGPANNNNNHQNDNSHNGGQSGGSNNGEQHGNGGGNNGGGNNGDHNGDHNGGGNGGHGDGGEH